MDRKDWLVPLLAALIGVMGTLGGSLVVGYQHERAAVRQAQVDLVKQQSAERAKALKTFKQAGLSYMAAMDALVNSWVFAPARDKALPEHLALVQNASHEVVLMGDEALTRQTLSLNQTLTRLLLPSPLPMGPRLDELNEEVVDWIKHFKRSLDAMNNRHDEALGWNASVQVSAPLTR